MKLHSSLAQLFDAHPGVNLRFLLEHSDFQAFSSLHNLSLPQQELVLCFTHASFCHEFKVTSQETLEFLGDAVLQLIISDALLRRHPGEQEGKLSKLRSSLVNEKTLATLGRSLQIGDLILLGKGEFRKGLFQQDVVLADTLEALIGQIFRHQGFEFTQRLVLNWYERFLPEAFSLSGLDEFDAKSRLQEATLAKYKTLPRYSAQPAGVGFLVQVWVNEKLMAHGEFSSKKIGERELAAKVLKEKLF